MRFLQITIFTLLFSSMAQAKSSDFCEGAAFNQDMNDELLELSNATDDIVTKGTSHVHIPNEVTTYRGKKVRDIKLSNQFQINDTDLETLEKLLGPTSPIFHLLFGKHSERSGNKIKLKIGVQVVGFHLGKTANSTLTHSKKVSGDGEQVIYNAALDKFDIGFEKIDLKVTMKKSGNGYSVNVSSNIKIHEEALDNTKPFKKLVLKSLHSKIKDHLGYVRKLIAKQL